MILWEAILAKLEQRGGVSRFVNEAQIVIVEYKRVKRRGETP
jgi:hypothetical protein